MKARESAALQVDRLLARRELLTHDGAARRQAAWLFGGNVRYSCSTRQHNQLASLNVSIELIKSSAVGDKATVLRNFRGLKHRRQTESRNPFHDGLPVIEHEWCRQDVERCSAGTPCDIDRAYDLFRPSHLID
jgi:hypothetical protein